jgi:hypothetical protein
MIFLGGGGADLPILLVHVPVYQLQHARVWLIHDGEPPHLFAL